MVGTFLVRSGILTSVHAFAVDPERGTFILALLAIYIGGALTLFALRVGTVSEGERVRGGQPRGRAGGQQRLLLGGSSASCCSARSIRCWPRRCRREALGRAALFQPVAARSRWSSLRCC